MRSRALKLIRQQPLALLALFVALGGSSYAATAGSGGRDADNVIVGCVGENTGRLRVVDSPIRCGSLETPISFNREGKRGVTGKRGPAGKRGPVGTTGAAGVNGKDGANGAKGDTGNDGAQGVKGDNGGAGRDGTDGANALTATAPEAAGANCATGGIKVTTGVDANRNSTLDAGEVNAAATRYVCNGAQGPRGVEGVQGLTGADGQSVVASPESAGANCTNGGVKYTSASGINYVCNGSAGQMTAGEFQTQLDAATVDADTLGGVSADGFVRGSQFNASFNTAFDNSIRGLFGGTDSTMMNGSGGTDRYLGEVFATAVSFPPPGTAFASGQELSIQQYTALFSLLGTQYGGNGTTTFALPDLRRQGPGGTNYVIVVNGLFPSRP